MLCVVEVFARGTAHHPTAQISIAETGTRDGASWRQRSKRVLAAGSRGREQGGHG